jgi:hypothetical protein
VSARLSVTGPALKARGSQLTETHLSSSEVRNRIGGGLRGADDIVRYGMRRRAQTQGDPNAQTWYSEAEGLVPSSVLSHIVRYNLYAR